MADETPDLFAPPPATPPPPRPVGSLDLPYYRQQIAQLAAHRLFLGTSSWKYPGWCGGIYDEPRYLTRGKFSEASLSASVWPNPIPSSGTVSAFVRSVPASLYMFT
jgi:hypothetical protein